MPHISQTNAAFCLLANLLNKQSMAILRLMGFVILQTSYQRTQNSIESSIENN